MNRNTLQAKKLDDSDDIFDNLEETDE